MSFFFYFFDLHSKFIKNLQRRQHKEAAFFVPYIDPIALLPQTLLIISKKCLAPYSPKGLGAFCPWQLFLYSIKIRRKGRFAPFPKGVSPPLKPLTLRQGGRENSQRLFPIARVHFPSTDSQGLPYGVSNAPRGSNSL